MLCAILAFVALASIISMLAALIVAIRLPTGLVRRRPG